MTIETPWHMIHSAATARLLELAFASGDDALLNGGGYTFRVVTRAGTVFEGCPAVSTAKEVGHVLAFEGDTFVLASEIAAITVTEC